MNIPMMMDELVRELEKATSSIQLQTKNKQYKAPQVVAGYLPPKNPRDQQVEDFPYVIVRYLSDSEVTAQVKVLCGIHSEDDQQGWRELVNLLDAIKTHLLSKRFFGKCFEIERPLKREIPEEQGAPEWVGWLSLTVSIPNIQGVNENVERILNGN